MGETNDFEDRRPAGDGPEAPLPGRFTAPALRKCLDLLRGLTARAKDAGAINPAALNAPVPPSGIGDARLDQPSAERQHGSDASVHNQSPDASQTADAPGRRHNRTRKLKDERLPKRG
jgi:hypothetical protein